MPLPPRLDRLALTTGTRIAPSLDRVLQELKRRNPPTELEVSLAIDQIIRQARAGGDHARANYPLAWKASGPGRGP